MSDGWLVAQLPRPLAEDDFTRRFVTVFERLATSLRERADGLEVYFDADVAPPELVRAMGSWLGIELPRDVEPTQLRHLLLTAGPLVRWRGTRRGLEGLVAALTGGEVTAEDSGGVFGEGGATGEEPEVVVRVEQLGALTEEQLSRLVRAEVPVHARVEIVVDDHTLTEGDAPEDEDGPEVHPPDEPAPEESPREDGEPSSDDEPDDGSS